MVERLRSTLLSAAGFRHGFALRAAPFAGAAPACGLSAAENERRFAELVGFDPKLLFRVTQVHGAGVAVVGNASDPSLVEKVAADALVAAVGGMAIAVATADCLPLLLADPDTGAVAAVHAGWRGLLSGVVPATLAKLQQACGTAAGRLQAAILPHIRSCCFEIGAEVAERLAELTPAAVETRSGAPRAFGRLSVGVRHQLQQAGVGADVIDELPGCTMCDPGRFHSYRRTGRGAGRHLSAIVAGVFGA